MEHFGIMLDCSRNGILTVASVKRYIDILSSLGYNCLMLYTEDTYEIPEQPYFGYLRGRYTQQELRELDCYGKEKGIELIPCIQTLAHLNAMVRWQAFKPYVDVRDILLCEDFRTYALIEDMFRSLAASFSSRTVNIGMDEAHMVGLGKYLQEHGYRERYSILLKHLEKVCEIAKKYGFKPLMWSDMFFRLCNNGIYYCDNPITPSEEVASAVPEDVELIYWDYYYDKSSHYDAMIQAHKAFRNPLWFAGGLWTWTGFVPKNAMSMANTAAAMESARNHGISNVIFTQWGDDGQECSLFAVLPALYYAAQLAKGITDMTAIREGFHSQFGIDFDDFMLLDLPGTIPPGVQPVANPDKYMFYNDPFLGIFDSVVTDFVPDYTGCARKLEALADHPEYGYLFLAVSRLCECLAVKYDLGVRTRRAYRAGNREKIAQLLEEYRKLITLIDSFYDAHRARWFRENKPFGFEVQDVRIGALKQRISHCAQRLEAWVKEEILVIEELEENILPEFAPGTRHNNWCSQVSPGALGMDYVGK